MSGDPSLPPASRAPRAWGPLAAAALAALVATAAGARGWTEGDGGPLLAAAAVAAAAVGLLCAAWMPVSRRSQAVLAAAWALLLAWGMLTVLSVGAPLLVGAAASGVPLWRRAAARGWLGLTALVAVWTAAATLLLVTRLAAE